MEIFLTVVIPSLTSLAALITAIAAFKTIKEMKTQRKSSLLPEPAFSKTYFNTYWGQTKKGLPIYWSSRELEEPDFDVDSYPASRSYFDVQFECFNVGFGVAKEVQIIWDFNLEEFVDSLEKLDKTNKFSFTLEESGYLRIFSKELDYLSVLKNGKVTPLEFKFILPVGISDKSNLARVPIAYTELYSIFLYLFIHDTTDKSSISLDDIPSLNAIISYSDIESTEYEREYIASFKFPVLSGMIEGKKWSKAATVEVDFAENT